MPIVFVALIDVMRREHRVGWLRAYAAHGGAVTVAIAAIMQLNSPLSALVKPSSYVVGPRVTSAHEVMALVPEGASVETDLSVMRHLASRNTVYWYWSIGDAEPDYVLLNTRLAWFKPDGPGAIRSLKNVVAYAEAKHGGNWTLIYNKNGYQLARRS